MEKERGRGAWACGVAALTAAVFARTVSGAFLDFDDHLFLVGNPHFQGWSWENARWMIGDNWILWYPVTWLSYAADYSLWGLRPAGYHLTSVLLHALNAALAFLLFDRLMKTGGAAQPGARRAAAAFGALLFSLHPLRVESVSWASERCDVLCGCFALATVLAWLDGRDLSALGLHALALGSKATAMPIPLVLGLLDALRLTGRPWPGYKKECARLAPMIALSAADGWISAAAQARVGATWSLDALGPAARLSIGAWNYAHALAKTLWPARLQALYPMPRPFSAGETRFLLAGALVLLMTALAWRLRRRAPAFSAAWGCCLLLLAPVAGFLKIGGHLAADRYTYLATLGFAGLAAEAWRRARLGRLRRAAAALALAALAALSAATWARQGDWLDSERFWSKLVEDPGDALARQMLARIRVRQGRTADAARLIEEAIAIDPSDAAALNQSANLLADLGRDQQAVARYRAAIAAAPGHAITRYNLAKVLLRLGRRDEAAAALREELALIRRTPPDPLRRELRIDPDESRAADLLRQVEAAR